MPGPTGATGVYCFGPFQLDAGRLLRDDEPVILPPRQVTILLLLVVNAGHFVSKLAIANAGWPDDEEVTDNSITQAMHGIRTALGEPPDKSPYVTTMINHGYRFNAPVTCVQPRPPAISVGAGLAANRAVVEVRAALETLDRDVLPQVQRTLADLLVAAPGNAAGHIAIVHACVLEIESKRVDGPPDPILLKRAIHHARAACASAPRSGLAWRAQALAFDVSGDFVSANAAARTAVELEAYDWGHHLCLSRVSWGSVRIHAAYCALQRCPGLALAHWLIATVFIARHAFREALDILDAGCTAQDAQRPDGAINAVGLHYLRASVFGAQNRLDEAIEECRRELASTLAGHVFGRECYANTWYATGAFHLRLNRPDEAAPAFREALSLVPGHALATLGLAIATGGDIASARRHGANHWNPMDRAMAEAAGLAVEGMHPEAAQVILTALGKAGPGSAGWQVVTDPLIHATAHPEVWAPVFALLRDRAR